MSKEQCAFAQKEPKSSEFAGNSGFAAIYNIAPIVPGHSLVIPRRHIKRINELSEDEFGRYWLFARDITNFLLHAFKTDAFDWIVQEQKAAGQTVPHLHLHIIPRVAEDFVDPGDWYPRLSQGRIVDPAHEVVNSNDRVRLSIDEHKRITSELANQWQMWNMSDTR
ncbi:MAG TPA: HIT family protein [Mycobacteriales bacterium]|nr:HIT family protein [Mycobacteriales bacterium]